MQRHRLALTARWAGHGNSNLSPDEIVREPALFPGPRHSSQACCAAAVVPFRPVPIITADRYRHHDRGQAPCARLRPQSRIPFWRCCCAPVRRPPLGAGDRQRHWTAPRCIFAAALPHLRWQTSDLKAQPPGICLWLATGCCPTRRRRSVSRCRQPLAGAPPDAVYIRQHAAISCPGPRCRRCSSICRRCSMPAACSPVHGPFRYDGAHTSDSNAAFDAKCAARGRPAAGRARLRGGGRAGLRGRPRTAFEDRAMPATTAVKITWRRVAAA